MELHNINALITKHDMYWPTDKQIYAFAEDILKEYILKEERSIPVFDLHQILLDQIWAAYTKRYGPIDPNITLNDVVNEICGTIASDTDYETLEREHLGDATNNTGIYHPDVIEAIKQREMPDFTGVGDAAVAAFADASIRYEGIPAVSEMLSSNTGGFLSGLADSKDAVVNCAIQVVETYDDCTLSCVTLDRDMTSLRNAIEYMQQGEKQ